MTSNIVSLTTSYRESRRLCSFASDTFIILPTFDSILSQHEDCIFAFPFPREDPNESILLSEPFATDEGVIEITRDYLKEDLANNRSVLCLLDAKEENLYNASKYKNKCVLSAGSLSSFSCSGKGDVLAVAFCNGILSFYRIVSDDDAWIYLEHSADLKTNAKNITSIAFDATDKYLACGTVDGSVIVYHERALFQTFRSQKGIITVVRFHPKTLMFIAATQNGGIMLYSLELKAPIAKFEDHLSYVTDISFLVTADGSEGFVSSSRDSTINLWSLDIDKKQIKTAGKIGELLLRKPFKHILQFEAVCSIAVVASERGRNCSEADGASWKLLVATENGNIKYVDPLSGLVIKERQSIYGQGAALKCVRLFKDKQRIIVMGSSGSLCFYTLDLELKEQFMGNIDGIFQFQLYKGTEISDWSKLRHMSDNEDWWNSVLWFNRKLSRGVPLAFVLFGDDAVRILAIDNGLGDHITLGLGSEEHRHTDSVLSIAYSQGANILASGSKDERVLVWDLRSLLVIATVNVDGLSVACLALPNNLKIDCTNFSLIVSGDNVLKSFDVTVSKRPKMSNVVFSGSSATAVVHKKVINAVAFSPNNKLLASASNDKLIFVYATDNLIVRGSCAGHRRSVVSVEFMRTAKMLLSASVDQTIKIWNISNFTCVKTFQGHTKAVMRAIVLPNDMQLLSAGMDGLIKLWNIRTSDCISTFDNHSDKVWNVEIYGEHLLSISGNGLMLWWDDISKELEQLKLQEEWQEELKRTQIESLAAEGKHGDALCLAVEMKNPHLASNIIIRSCEMAMFGGKSEVNRVQPRDIFRTWVAHLKLMKDTKKHLTVVFDFISLWNSKSRTSWMANCLLYEILQQFTPTEIFAVEGLSQRIDKILTYQSTHQSRFLNLIEKSHILDILMVYNTPSHPATDTSEPTASEILYG